MTKQNGSALITSLMVVALLSAIVSLSLISLNHYKAYINNIITKDENSLALQLADHIGISFLKKNHSNFFSNNSDGLIKTIHEVLPKTSSNKKKLFLRIEIYDLQSQVNINNLIDPLFFSSVFKYISNHYNLQISKTNFFEIYNWITAPIIGQNHNTQHAQRDHKSIYEKKINQFSNVYLKFKFPYIPAHQFFFDIAELRMLSFINRRNFYLFSRDFVALPEFTSLNVLTAPASKLKLVSSLITNNEVTKLQALRREKKLTAIKRWLNKYYGQGLRNEQISIGSNYYLLKTIVQAAQNKYTHQKVIKFVKANNSYKLDVKTILIRDQDI